MKKYFLFFIVISLSLTQFSCENDTLKDHREEIRAYLEASGKIDNSVETESGVFVYFLEEGNQGNDTPSASSTVNIKYRGYLFPDGETFDDSFNNTVQFTQIGNGGLIAGFSIGLQEMKRGDKAEIYIPSVLGYGNLVDQPTSSGVTIEAGSILTFNVEMVDFF